MKFLLAVLAAVAICHVHAFPAKVPSSLYKTLATQGTADIMVILREPVSPVVASINRRRFATRDLKTTQLVQELRQFTQLSQQPIVSFLSKRTNQQQVKSFYISNRISVSQAPSNLIEDLLHNFGEHIAEIRGAKVVRLPEFNPTIAPATWPETLEWGVDRIEADLLWPEGINGAGVVVSAIDTGVRHTHMGFSGSQQADYNWFDSTIGQSESPIDDTGHGTHMMGSMIGNGGTGVAPRSKYLHCRAFTNGTATEASLIACGQFILCPTLPDGREEDCSKRPDVVSNGWTEGQEDTFYNDIIDAWRAADIIPVFAIGDSGTGCSTANSPGDQPNVISVGAINELNLIRPASSRGPSKTALRIKPELSAPGTNIRSASIMCDMCYVYNGGTTSAAAHVAGAVALLKQKNPEATFDQVKEALQTTAYRVPMGEVLCPGGGVNATNPWPNNRHGYGTVRVNLAVEVI